MVYTIEEIQKKAIPIVQEYGVTNLSLFDHMIVEKQQMIVI